MRMRSNGMFILGVIGVFVLLAGLLIFRRPQPPVAPPVAKPPAVKKVPKPKPPVTEIKGTIALILDDWGNSMRHVETIEEIGIPMTIAVLPNLPYSTEVAERLHPRGFEIMLHLPMQPQSENNLEPDTIMTGMPRKKVESIISRALADVPHASGANNHMGSKATQDARLMSMVMDYFREKGLYFVDSYSSPGSVCQQVAGDRNCSFIRRDIFIDNTADRAYIRQQLHKLMNKAARTGYAVGIGHDRKLTIEVLKEELPAIAAEGYRFVTISTLIRQRK